MKTLKKLVDIACMVDMYLNFTFLVALKLAVANLKIRSSISMYQDGYDIFVVVSCHFISLHHRKSEPGVYDVSIFEILRPT